MAGSSDWISVSEAERLTGLSVRTIKRMAAEGQLTSSRTPGDHMRVLRADVDRLLRRETLAPQAPASSVLQSKRERVEELSLQLQETRALREIRKLSQEDAEAERRTDGAKRAQVLADKRALEETRLRAARDAERREREQREAEAQRRRAEFLRRWVSFATDCFPAWLSYEQRQMVLAAVEETISVRDPGDAELMPRLLGDTISRICAPWESERQAGQRREELIELTMTSGLPSGATDSEKARAAASARSALALVPTSASDWELRAAVSAAVEPMVKAVEQRKTAEREKERQRVEAERVRDAERRAREEREAKARADAILRRIRKGNIVAAGVAHVSSYLSELFREDEITRDEWLDFAWQRELQEQVRKALESELTGTDDESENDARQIAEEIVDEELP
ncbi:MAG TPA: helix-turn-helix domain-containing protein [Candidatus Acidoferrum sp.]|nr:helix-turn-helix domain-containing protein [Candidatus Acidoferrum sp.]